MPTPQWWILGIVGAVLIAATLRYILRMTGVTRLCPDCGRRFEERELIRAPIEDAALHRAELMAFADWGSSDDVWTRVTNQRRVAALMGRGDLPLIVSTLACSNCDRHEYRLMAGVSILMDYGERVTRASRPDSVASRLDEYVPDVAEPGPALPGPDHSRRQPPPTWGQSPTAPPPPRAVN